MFKRLKDLAVKPLVWYESLDWFDLAVMKVVSVVIVCALFFFIAGVLMGWSWHG